MGRPSCCSDPFEELKPLNGSETLFLEAVKAGKVYNANGGQIRASFFRTLLLSADNFQNAALGVGIENCVIDSTINVSGAKIDRLVSITGSKINGDFIFNHTEFKALFLDGTHLERLQGVRSRISSSIYLRSLVLPNKSNPESLLRFEATKGVDLSGSKIEGALSARGACIKNVGGSALALNLADADINSIMLGPKDDKTYKNLKNTYGYEANECRIDGGISFQRARCKSFADSELAYESILSNTKKKEKRPKLILRGFRYESLGRMAPRSLKFRKKWLEADSSSNERFDPQPYEQLATVLRMHGEIGLAHGVLISKEQKKYPLGMRGLNFIRNPLIHLFLGPIGFGYKPYLVIIYMIVLIFLGGAVFENAYKSGSFSPRDSALMRSEAWAICQSRKALDQHTVKKDTVSSAKKSISITKSEAVDLQNNYRISSVDHISDCKNKPLSNSSTTLERALFFYPEFNGYWYSADVILPIVNLGQKEFWVAHDLHNGWRSMQFLNTMLTLIGWLLSSLGIGGALSYLNRS